ncbi:SecDF P1 head subdomain-containing protein [Pseudomonas aeruginosa]|uniref:SecDF P1 head subdomain-containing protein n=1 Tax=Pseudomonas aeruginosa TaxID=287 RepID=UPI003D03CDCB
MTYSAPRSCTTRTVDPASKSPSPNRAARRLAALTGEARGRTLAVLVDGRLRLAPRVREPIRNGKVYLDGLASVYEARELADQLNALGSQPGR